jgi:hypothetical protein
MVSLQQTVIDDCTFEGNSAIDGDGRGVELVNNYSYTTIEHCTFDTASGYSGAIGTINSSPIIVG